MPYNITFAAALVLATLDPSYSAPQPQYPLENDQIQIPTSQPALHDYYYQQWQNYQNQAYEDTLRPESGVEEPPKPDEGNSDSNYMYYYY